MAGKADPAPQSPVFVSDRDCSIHAHPIITRATTIVVIPAPYDHAHWGYPAVPGDGL